MRDYVYVLNRELLGPQGLILSEDDYVRLVAAMGIPLPPEGSQAKDSVNAMEWTVGNFRRSLSSLPRGGFQRTSKKLIDGWRSQIAQENPISISLQSVRQWMKAPFPTDVLGILSHSSVGAEAVRLDWSSPQADLKWRWPMRVGALEDDFNKVGLQALSDNNLWPANKLTRPQVVDREHARIEVLIVRAEMRVALARLLALKHNIRAVLILLVGPLDQPWPILRPHLDVLMTETQAAGLAIIQPASDELIVHHINTLVGLLAHLTSVDIALGKAFGPGRSLMALDSRLLKAVKLNRSLRTVASRLMRLPPATRIMQPMESVNRLNFTWNYLKPVRFLAEELITRESSGNIPFTAEVEGASVVAEIEPATRSMERTQAAREHPRYLQGDVYRFSYGKAIEETKGLVLNSMHALDVFIGEAGLGTISVSEPVPDREIEWGDEGLVTLQVILAEPNQLKTPLCGALILSRYGRSSTYRFAFSPTRTGPFQGRLILYYHGRVLQTALLEAQVAASPDELTDQNQITLRVEAQLRRSLATLPDRRRFDACIVCNHTASRQAALTAAGRDGAYIASLNKLNSVTSNINHLLTQVAQDADRYRTGLTSNANAQLLRRLAVEGNALYRSIVIDYIGRSASAHDIQKADYLQIVTMEPDAIVPLEFVYDFPVPCETAPVCPKAIDALRDGKCPDSCQLSASPAEYVCPLGFWGIRKVIERHIHVPGLDKAAKVIAWEPIAGRDKLSLKGSTLIGMSNQVGSPSDQKLIKGLKKIRKAGIKTASNWKGWTQSISSDKPVMLIVLPHAGGAAADISLEIGGDTVKSVFINESYVHVASTPPPLTVLLGCDTANTADTSAYLHHVGVFRQADAALVIGTIATVFGKHAADMAERLIGHLEAAIQSKPGRFGEVLRKAKCMAVADSLMIGLCLVAFGDADWLISMEEGHIDGADLSMH